MIVADTSPLNYLILIEQIEILPRLYGSVFIPTAVQSEMLHHAAPEPVRKWIEHAPHWLEVHSPTSILTSLPAQLGNGEREAISLAIQVNPSFIVLDETLGRNTAKSLFLPVIGILGVLREASDKGLLDLSSALDRLQTTSFHSTPALLRRIQQQM